jgi:gamma-glutamyl:cysteine ligase YbdK (ATP-grasp superfamily)
MPLDVFPGNPRYAKIARTLPKDVLLAALRVTGTHIHVGVGSMAEAIQAHNAFADLITTFQHLGDHSNGERIRLYRSVSGDTPQPRYADATHFYDHAVSAGFADNPRNCWDLVRISRHGTVELRMFGMTEDVDETVSWAVSVLDTRP